MVERYLILMLELVRAPGYTLLSRYKFGSIASVFQAAPNGAHERIWFAGIVHIYYSPANGDDVQRSWCCSRERAGSIVDSYLIARLVLVEAPGFTLHSPCRSTLAVASLRFYGRLHEWRS